MSETDISRGIRETLARLGVIVWRNQAGTMQGGRVHLAPKGTPDLIGVLPGGRFLGLEVKRPGQKPTEVQLQWQRDLIAKGAVCAVVTSVQEAVDVVRTAMLPAVIEYEHPKPKLKVVK